MVVILWDYRANPWFPPDQLHVCGMTTTVYLTLFPHDVRRRMVVRFSESRRQYFNCKNLRLNKQELDFGEDFLIMGQLNILTCEIAAPIKFCVRVKMSICRIHVRQSSGLKWQGSLWPRGYPIIKVLGWPKGIGEGETEWVVLHLKLLNTWINMAITPHTRATHIFHRWAHTIQS